MVNVNPEIQQEAQLLIAKNQKILAVKLIIDHTRCGLKEAKDYRWLTNWVPEAHDKSC